MEKYSFFDAQQGTSGYDRTYSSSDLADYFASFVGNGVFANPANQLKVVVGTGLQVQVLPGKAWINGYFYELSEASKQIALTRGDNNYGRIDRVVCSLNMGKRLIEVKVVEGTVSASPEAPAYSRTDEQYDLVLAEISVPAGTTAISTSLIRDTRGDSDKCGFVKGVIEQIDTTDLFAQYEDEFTTWFEGAKDALSGDVAGNLTTRMDAAEKGIESNENGVTSAFGQIASLDNRVEINETSIASIRDSLKNHLLEYEKKITMGTSAAPSTGTANSIYIQLL